jgi:hypothetical protein
MSRIKKQRLQAAPARVKKQEAIFDGLSAAVVANYPRDYEKPLVSTRCVNWIRHGVITLRRR